MPLKNCKVLVVEDEFLLADDLSRALGESGAEVIGPFGATETAIAALSDQHIDAAVLDINLQGQRVFSLAEMLSRRGVPFVFATGYGTESIPELYAATPRWQKPYPVRDLVEQLPALIAAGRDGQSR